MKRWNDDEPTPPKPEPECRSCERRLHLDIEHSRQPAFDFCLDHGWNALRLRLRLPSGLGFVFGGFPVQPPTLGGLGTESHGDEEATRGAHVEEWYRAELPVCIHCKRTFLVVVWKADVDVVTVGFNGILVGLQIPKNVPTLVNGLARAGEVS